MNDATPIKADIERAIHDSSVTGEVIKPILTMP